MFWPTRAGLVWVASFLVACSARQHVAQSAEAATDASSPTRYEISINGEHFTIDGGRLNKLKSTEKPGTTYDVAVRLAEYQRWHLGNVRFDYHQAFTVNDDASAATRTATLKHGLGFVIMISNLGGALAVDEQKKTLDNLSQTLQKAFRGSGAVNVSVSDPQQQKMGSSQVRGQTISYDDADAVTHTALVYLVCGLKFTCSCIVEFLEVDRDDVMPLVKPTLESFEPIRQAKPKAHGTPNVERGAKQKE